MEKYPLGSLEQMKAIQELVNMRRAGAGGGVSRHTILVRGPLRITIFLYLFLYVNKVITILTFVITAAHNPSCKL